MCGPLSALARIVDVPQFELPPKRIHYRSRRSLDSPGPGGYNVCAEMSAARGAAGQCVESGTRAAKRGEPVTHLSIRLLGPFDVTLDGEPVTGF